MRSRRQNSNKTEVQSTGMFAIARRARLGENFEVNEALRHQPQRQSRHHSREHH